MTGTVFSSVTGADSGGGVITFTLTGALQDDVVVVGVVYGGNAEVGMLTSGYVSAGGDASSCSVFAYWKRIGASPDASAQVNSSTSGQGKAAVCFILRGIHATTAIDVVATDGLGASTNPDAASIVTSSDDALVLVLGGSEVADFVVTEPAGYSAAVSTASTGFSGGISVTVGAATKVVAVAGAEDPASFTGWSTGNWRTLTMAFRSAAVAPAQGITPSHYSSGIVFFSPTIELVLVTPTLYSNQSEFFVPQLVFNIDITPNLIENSNVFHAVNVAIFELVDISFYENVSVFHAPLVLAVVHGEVVVDMPAGRTDYGMRNSQELTKERFVRRRF